MIPSVSCSLSSRARPSIVLLFPAFKQAELLVNWLVYCGVFACCKHACAVPQGGD